MRAVRGLWPDRNPLRRGLDRVEAAVVGALIIAFLAGAPLAASAAGHAVYNAGSRTAHAQRVGWRQVPAVLLAADSGDGGYPVTVPARWAAPDGASRTGMVPAPPEARTGSTVIVWVDAAGLPTGPPLRFSYVRGRAVLAGMLAAIVVGFVLLWVGHLVCSSLDQRRLAAWDADWRATGPQWTGRRLPPARPRLSGIQQSCQEYRCQDPHVYPAMPGRLALPG